ncbi:hypothetical protein V2J09_007490 [Rumex salicifolius]
MPADGSFDLFRMLRISAYGLLIMGPSQHYWFTSLSKIMPQKEYNHNLVKKFNGSDHLWTLHEHHFLLIQCITSRKQQK